MLVYERVTKAPPYGYATLGCESRRPNGTGVAILYDIKGSCFALF